MRLVFPAEPALVGQVAELAAREQQCCRFFEFTLSLSPEDIVFDARAPLGAEDLVHAVFEEVTL